MPGELLTINGESNTIVVQSQLEATVYLTGSDIKRFWEKVDVRDPLECWKWKAAILQSGGYGAFRLNGVTQRAHRIAYFLMKGELISGFELLHRCNVPSCCNPYHLVQDTHQANLLQAGQDGKMTRNVGTNSKCQFSDEQLFDILSAKCSARELARKYKVDHKTIRRIQQEFQLCPIS